MPLDCFPTDPRTLLKTPRSISVESLEGGEFYYFGIHKAIEHAMLKGLEAVPVPTFLKGVENLVFLKVGIDGVPLSKSSNLQFWPILFSIDQAKSNQVHIAGLFYGNQKPSNITQFLEKFVEEIKVFETDGIKMNGVSFNIRIRCIMADAPARSFIKCIRTHNAYYGCERCYSKGSWSGRVIYRKGKSETKHTDETFKLQTHENHHEGTSPLMELDFKVITQIPLDYMHLVCLGVMKKMLMTWTEGKLPHRLSPKNIREISDRLVSFRNRIPEEFSRKSRSLKELHHWKATEYRTFLLYTGPAALRDILDKGRFEHFMLFHTAMYVFSSDAASLHDWLEYGESLIDKFVSDIPELYYEEMLVYNMHSLMHLGEDVRVHGKVDNFSTFEFENFMQTLKRMIRTNKCHLSQVVVFMKQKAVR